MPDSSDSPANPKDLFGITPPKDSQIIKGLKQGDYGYWNAFVLWNDKRQKNANQNKQNQTTQKKMTKPQNDLEALVRALEVVLSAPTKQDAATASELADEIATRIPPEQVKGCKAIALANWKASKE